MLRNAVLTSCAALTVAACASAPQGGGTGADGLILAQSSRASHWPVEGETQPGIWIRFEPVMAPVPTAVLLDSVHILVEHAGRTQVITGAAFEPIAGGGDSRQTRYLYTPTSGTLFLTLQLRAPGARAYFPDTQRIELDDDCWHMVSYRVRSELPAGGPPPPPPYPRTVLLSPALSGDPLLFLDVFVSGNCFRNPRPPHE